VRTGGDIGHLIISLVYSANATASATHKHFRLYIFPVALIVPLIHLIFQYQNASSGVFTISIQYFSFMVTPDLTNLPRLKDVVAPLARCLLGIR
jgi:hypothetical protein